MSDKYTLGLKNFRSIRDAEIDIAPLTVVYGPRNGSGKSSLIYGLLTLKNFLTNPNQNLPGLFRTYPGLSLGGFTEVVAGHREESAISISLAASGYTITQDFNEEMYKSEFSMEAAESGGKLLMALDGSPLVRPLNMALDVSFPYHGNQSTYGKGLFQYGFPDEGIHPVTVDLEWNGIDLNLSRIEDDWLQGGCHKTSRMGKVLYGIS